MNNVTKVFHADHGVSNETIQWAVDQINPAGFFLRTLELPEGHSDLTNNLYGPAAGDAPIVGRTSFAMDAAVAAASGDADVTTSILLVRDERDEWRGATPFVNLPPRPTRLMTIIGMASDEGVTVFTCYGGPAAERIPSDPSLADDPAGKAAAEAFWAVHALSIAAKK